MDGGDLWGPFLKHDLYADGRLTCSAQEGYALSTHRNPFEMCTYLLNIYLGMYLHLFNNLIYRKILQNIFKLEFLLQKSHLNSI